MEKLNFPEYPFRIREEGGSTMIFDFIRKKWVTMTPEEWVRQNMMMYLIHDMNYPAGLMKVEASLTVNKLRKRADIVVYSPAGIPVLAVECKSPRVSLSYGTFEQLARYNLSLQVPLLIITNGIKHYCCKVNLKSQTFEVLDSIPPFIRSPI